MGSWWPLRGVEPTPPVLQSAWQVAGNSTDQVRKALFTDSQDKLVLLTEESMSTRPLGHGSHLQVWVRCLIDNRIAR